MNKLVLIFILLKLSSNLMLGIFDAAVASMSEFNPQPIIENTEIQETDSVNNYARVLSVER